MNFVMMQNGLFRHVGFGKQRSSTDNRDANAADYSLVEVAIINICSSLPLLPKFLQLVRHKRRGRSSPFTGQRRLENTRQKHERRGFGASAKYSEYHGQHSEPCEDSNTSTSRLATCYIPLQGIETGNVTSRQG